MRSRIRRISQMLAVAMVASATAALASSQDDVRVVYFFDPGYSEQVGTAALLQKLAVPMGIEAFGVVDEIDHPGLRRLTLPIFSRQTLRQRETKLEEEARRWQRHGLELLFAESGVTGTIVHWAPEDLQTEIFRLVKSMAGPVRTKIDVTTWGKMKELFN